MADNFPTNPVTTTGGSTFASDDIGGIQYPRMKLTLGPDGVSNGDLSSTNPMPASLQASTAVVGHVVVDSGASPSTTVDANLTSAGSTKVVGLVGQSGAWSVASSTTVDVNLSSAGSTRLVGTVSVATSTGQIGSVSLLAGSSANVVGSVALIAGTTANSLGSVALLAGSTGTMVGAVSVSSGVVLGAGSTANSIGSVALVAGTSANVVGSVALIAGSSSTLVGAVAVSSGVVLGAGSSANILGSVVINSATTGITVGSVALLAGTTANSIGSVALVAGTSANTVGSVALIAGSSANTLGSVVVSSNSNQAVTLNIGTSATYQFMQSIPFSSGNAARTSVNTTVDISVIAANSARKGLLIANLSTVQTVVLGLTTAVVTTALGGASLFLAPVSQISFGLGGNGFPLFLGPIRGINITSTTVAGGVCVTEFT